MKTRIDADESHVDFIEVLISSYKIFIGNSCMAKRTR